MIKIKNKRFFKSQKCVPIPGTDIEIPITEIQGAEPGPRTVITAGIHGGEYPGIAALTSLAGKLNPSFIKGSLTLVHMANPQSFWGRVPEVNPEDNKNLNREFPGEAQGTITEKTAWFLCRRVIGEADYYIDLHSGDIHEELCPHVYYGGLSCSDIRGKSRKLAETLNVPYRFCSRAEGGAYQWAAMKGIPSVLVERGGQGLCRKEDICQYEQDLERLLGAAGHLAYEQAEEVADRRQEEIKSIRYLCSRSNECWYPAAAAGQYIPQGGILGRSEDIFGKTVHIYRAEEPGIILYRNTSLALPKGKIAVALGVL